jgi:hypothetical protein
MGALALFRPARTEARQALHEAISAHAAAEQALIDARAGVGRGMRQADLAEERLASAVVATAEAKASLASAMSAPPTMPATLKVRDAAVRTARAEEVASGDHVDAARVALGELERQAIAAQTRLDEARAAVSNAANAVIADEALAPAIERARALRGELDAVTLKLSVAINRELACLKFLSDNREEVTSYRNIDVVGHASFRTIVLDWPRADEFREASAILASERKVVDMTVQRPARELWSGALAELHENPDAVLPL